MAFVPASQSIYRDHHDHQDPHFASPSSSCAPQYFHGVSQFLIRRSMSFSGMERADDDMSDDGSTMLGEKKRRLNLEQVRALEKSFESGNKLDAERKIQLARALGLRPRQVAIWFQNRRARWKTKQLERDYDVLKRQFEVVKADNDSLKSQNNKLQAQLMSTKSKETCRGQFNLVNKDKSALYLHSANKNAAVFPSTTTGLTQLLQSSSSHPSLQLFHNIDHPPASNDAFCNAMFGGIEEHSEFWSWSEQQNYPNSRH